MAGKMKRLQCMYSFESFIGSYYRINGGSRYQNGEKKVQEKWGSSQDPIYVRVCSYCKHQFQPTPRYKRFAKDQLGCSDYNRCTQCNAGNILLQIKVFPDQEESSTGVASLCNKNSPWRVISWHPAALQCIATPPAPTGGRAVTFASQIFKPYRHQVNESERKMGTLWSIINMPDVQSEEHQHQRVTMYNSCLKDFYPIR